MYSPNSNGNEWSVWCGKSMSLHDWNIIWSLIYVFYIQNWFDLFLTFLLLSWTFNGTENLVTGIWCLVDTFSDMWLQNGIEIVYDFYWAICICHAIEMKCYDWFYNLNFVLDLYLEKYSPCFGTFFNVNSVGAYPFLVLRIPLKKLPLKIVLNVKRNFMNFHVKSIV